MALLIVQVHRKWSGLNARPDESVIGHRSFDCWEEGSCALAWWGDGRHVFYNVVWYAATCRLRPPPIHARINSDFPNCPSPIYSRVYGFRIKMIPDRETALRQDAVQFVYVYRYTCTNYQYAYAYIIKCI